jgi:hypothetical protein
MWEYGYGYELKLQAARYNNKIVIRPDEVCRDPTRFGVPSV